MSNPFDAAIDYLKVHTNYFSTEEDIGQFYSAIRVLEAAGKVDKKKALEVYEEMSSNLYGEGWGDFEFFGVPVLPLLESLPDEVTK